MGKRAGKVRSILSTGGRTKILPIGEWGGHISDVRAIRLIARDSLPVQVAAETISLSAPYANEWNASIVLTPGGFGLAYSDSESEAAVTAAVRRYVDELIELLPGGRSFGIVLGVDGGDGSIQDAYYIPERATGSSDCIRAWKAYPRVDEEEELFTKGRPCPGRLVNRPDMTMLMLICHDLASFSARSKASRGPRKQAWARLLEEEVNSCSEAYATHLIHYLDSPSQGKSFYNAMSNLVAGAVKGGISSFKTALDPSVDRDALQVIQRRTTRFAGPTLDLYVKVHISTLKDAVK